MNYHYIDYMVKERQKEVLDTSERKRALYSAGYTRAGLVHEIRGWFVKAVHRLRKQWPARHRLLHPCCVMLKTFDRIKGESR